MYTRSCYCLTIDISFYEIVPTYKSLTNSAKNIQVFNKYIPLCLFLPLGLFTFILFAYNALPLKICMVHSFLSSLLKDHLIRQSLLTNHSHSSNLLPCFIFLYHTCLYLVIPHYIFFVCLFICLPHQNVSFFQCSGFDILLNALRFILST